MKTHGPFPLRLGCSFLLILPLVIWGTGCGTMKGGHRWGEDALHPVQWKRIPQAAKRALFDPVTWITGAGAIVFTIDHFDRKTSDWAANHTPVFGSPGAARDASDVLIYTLSAETLATGLATPSGDDPAEWVLDKAKGLLVEGGALGAVVGLTELGKTATDRLRPDGSDRSSFPSGHSSAAFGTARLSNRNLDALDLSPWVRTPLKAGNLIAASATAWARVEGQKHYPSDVLAGACLGNFVTSVIHDAFLNLPEDSKFSFYVEPSPHGLFASLSWDF